MKQQAGLVYFLLDDARVKKLFPTSGDKKEQLIACALFENNICTKYMSHNEFIEALFSKAYAELQVPEIVQQGFVGLPLSAFTYYQKGQSIFRFEIQDLNEKATQNILKNHKDVLTLNA